MSLLRKRAHAAVDPTITMGTFFAGLSTFPRAIMYIAAQSIGAIVAAFLLKLGAGSSNYFAAVCSKKDSRLHQTADRPGHNTGVHCRPFSNISRTNVCFGVHVLLHWNLHRVRCGFGSSTKQDLRSVSCRSATTS
jgi:hypothetical protein